MSHHNNKSGIMFMDFIVMNFATHSLLLIIDIWFKLDISMLHKPFINTNTFILIRQNDKRKNEKIVTSSLVMIR